MPAAILLKLSLLQQWEKNQCKEQEELESSPHQPHHQPEPKKNQQRHQCGSDAACIHLHSLTFHSQSHVCNSCVFSQFSHLGDRKTPILTIKKTRTRTFKYGLTEELGKGNITGDKLE